MEEEKAGAAEALRPRLELDGALPVVIAALIDEDDGVFEESVETALAMNFDCNSDNFNTNNCIRRFLGDISSCSC